MLRKERPDIINVSVENIKPNPNQPRKTFTDESLDELATSIKNYGLLQPIIVRRISRNSFELIAGERRWRAAQLLGLSEIPAVVRDSQDSESAVMALVENLQRENLHFLEEAEGYSNLLNEYNLTQEELAQKIGKNQSTIASKMRILKLSPEIKTVIYHEKLSERHARSLLRLHDEGLRKKVLAKICEKGLTVKETEALIERIMAKELEKSKEIEDARMFIRAFKDIRIFVNQVRKLVTEIKDIGLDAKYYEHDKGDFVEVVVQIPKSIKG